MKNDEFNKAVTFAISNGLIPSLALKYVYFMNYFKPEDLRLQSPYAHEWIGRFKDDPKRHMDNHCTAIYSAASSFVDTITERF